MKVRDVLERARPLDDKGPVTADECNALERFYRGNGPQPAGVVAVGNLPDLPYHRLPIDYADAQRVMLWGTPECFGWQ